MHKEKSKKKIIVVLPRGEAIKNFVYSGITDALRAEFDVEFFSIIPNSEIKQYLNDKCDSLYELNNKFTESHRSTELKHILQLGHLNKLNSVTGNLKILKDDVSSQKSIKNRVIRIVRKRIANFYDSQEKLIRLTNRFIKSNFKNPEVLRYEELLKKINPDLVFNTSHIHNSASLALMYACKKLNIKTASFLFSWDNLTSQGRILPDYDNYFTWNHKIKKDLLKYYPSINTKNVFVTGTPQFDFHYDEKFVVSKEELYKELGIPSNKKIVLYSTGMAYYTPKEHIHVIELDKTLKKIDKDLQLVVRIYAKDDNTEYYKLRENTDICVPDHYWELNYLTPTIKDITLFNSLLNHCVLGINVASTVSLELALLNKPVINIAFNPKGENVYPNDYEKIYDFDHYKPIVNSGAISLAKSSKELEDLIRLYSTDPETHQEERAKLIDNFFGDEIKENRKEKFVNVFKEILSDV